MPHRPLAGRSGEAKDIRDVQPASSGMPLRQAEKAFEERPGRGIVLKVVSEQPKRFVRLGISPAPRTHLADKSTERLIQSGKASSLSPVQRIDMRVRNRQSRWMSLPCARAEGREPDKAGVAQSRRDRRIDPVPGRRQDGAESRIKEFLKPQKAVPKLAQRLADRTNPAALD